VISEARTYLYFDVDDNAVTEFLPEGWIASPVASGAAQGADFIVILIDRKFATDAAGAARNPNLMLVFAVPGRNEQEQASGSVIVGGYSADPASVPGAYGNYQPATATLERVERAAPPAPLQAEETWSFEGDDGGRLNLAISYDRGTPTLGEFDSRVYSGTLPGFYRMYRGDQGVATIRSRPANVDTVDNLEFSVEGGIFGRIFDGSEEMIAINSFVWYKRQTFLP
jgi:hypothetical protein